MNKNLFADLVLRFGIAFVFIYAGVAGFLEPDSWVGYFPQFARDIVGEFLLLKIWGVFEIILAFWILSGKKIFISSSLASLSLLGLILSNLGAIDILFRDVAIFTTTLYLVIKNIPQENMKIK